MARDGEGRHAVPPAEGHDDREGVEAGRPPRGPSAVSDDGRGVPPGPGGGWLKMYHRRSKIEGVNGAIKRRLGATLWSVSDGFRRLELGLKLLVWNLIRLVYKEAVEANR